jgi:CheY-like chemotaxis protein
MENGEPLVLIEDNPDDAELIGRALRMAKIFNPVIVITDGDAALDYLNGQVKHAGETDFQKPILFLLDLKLPRRSGFEVLRAIRADVRTCRTPVVVLTSSNQERDIRTAYELGANSYLTKPMNQDDLAAMMMALGAYWIKFNKVAC